MTEQNCQDTEIIDKICHNTNTFHGFEEVCRLLSLNRVKITVALEEYIKRTIAGEWNEENAAWICGVENKINEISEEMKEKCMLNAVQADSSEEAPELLEEYS